MLSADAAFAMPPLRSWFRGREAIGAFLAGWPLSGQVALARLRACASGQEALAFCSWDPETESPTSASPSTSSPLWLALDRRGSMPSSPAPPLSEPEQRRCPGVPTLSRPSTRAGSRWPSSASACQRRSRRRSIAVYALVTALT